MKHVLKRLGLLLLSLFLFAYVGYQIFQVLYSNVTVETVASYSVFETVETQAVAIRRETLVNAPDEDGYLFYTLQNGERVAKGGTVAKRYSSEEVASTQQRLELLDEEIAALEEVETLSGSNYTSLEAINQQLASAARSVSLQMNSATVDTLRTLHTQLLTMMNKRQITIGTVSSFSERLSQLYAQREQIASQAAAPMGTITAPAAGYYIQDVDGYESLLPQNEADIAAMTPDAVQAALQATPNRAEGCVGKVAEDFTWYLTCVIDSEKAAVLETGRALRIQLPFVTGETLSTTVVAVNRDNAGQAAVVLKCSRMSEALAAVRVQTVQLLLREYSGLRLPDKALRFDEENRAGAYVRFGTAISFRYVNVLYHNEKDGYSICEIVDDSDYVRLYDDVIVEGKELYDGKIVQS